MQALAGVPLEPIEASAGELMKSLKQLQEDLVDELYPLYNQSGFEKQKELLGKIETFKWGSSRGQYIKDHTPTQFGTRDSEAINQGIKVPDHLYFEAVAAECFSRSQSAAEFLKLSLRLLKTLDVPAAAGTSSTRGKKVFIGHGGSLLSLKLRIFLLEKLHLECDEFNEESPAGIPTATRLKTMVDEAKFAFLVMTSEDFHADGTTHARENVVHEAGLFQGHLGFDKAIILLEEGCAEFSNIHGLGQIRFPKNNIEAIFEKIRDVLK
jgi:predicted nucleotide-binding protein